MTTFFAFIFVLGILIFVHELGHFLVARLCGIRVEKFSLGFPPKLISRKVGETEYMLSWIPLGGYVKLSGENPEESTGANPWEFMAKPVWKRALVIVAGPAMNFVLAFFLFWGILFVNGRQEAQMNSTVIGQLNPPGPADKGGIKPGDKILSVNGTLVTNFDQMAEIIYENVEKPVLVKWEREGQVFEKDIVTIKEKTYDQIMNTNLRGYFMLSQMAARMQPSEFAALMQRCIACHAAYTVLPPADTEPKH